MEKNKEGDGKGTNVDAPSNDTIMRTKQSDTIGTEDTIN